MNIKSQIHTCSYCNVKFVANNTTFNGWYSDGIGCCVSCQKSRIVSIWEESSSDDFLEVVDHPGEIDTVLKMKEDGEMEVFEADGKMYAKLKLAGA